VRTANSGETATTQATGRRKIPCTEKCGIADHKLLTGGGLLLIADISPVMSASRQLDQLINVRSAPKPPSMQRTRISRRASMFSIHASSPAARFSLRPRVRGCRCKVAVQGRSPALALNLLDWHAHDGSGSRLWPRGRRIHHPAPDSCPYGASPRSSAHVLP